MKTVLIVLLALFWVAATNHCRLEQLSGLAFMACCDQEVGPGSQDKDCETDGCATVENQLYKTENAQEVMPAPAVLLAFFLSPLFDELLSLAAFRNGPPETAPLELPRMWQFSYRTALPPRPPSLAS